MYFIAVITLFGFLLSGCASHQTYVGQGPHPQITRGHSIPPIDFLGNVLALPGKIILWNWKFANHNISEPTEAMLVSYLDSRELPAFEDTHYRLNQYSPWADMKALAKNKHVAWPYRLIIGFPVTLLTDVLLPGRLFPWGDYFNPYNNTVHLYSDDTAIALHESGHAHDFAEHPYKGTYAAGRILPFMDLMQEWSASDKAIDYFREIGDREAEMHAYKVLWPAYGTYVGGYAPIPLGSASGALVGHFVGRYSAYNRSKFYKRMDAALSSPNQNGGNEE